MSKENEKKGLFGRIIGAKKPSKGSCCCGFEVEEVPEEKENNCDCKDSEDKDGGCCNKA